MDYTLRERFWFVVLAVVGIIGVNGTFVWAALTRPDTVLSAIKNPIAAAFIGEAFLLLGVLAYLLARWRISQVHWAWFVCLALIGSLAFALPVVLLWSEGKQRTVGRSIDPPFASGDSNRD